MTLRLLCALAAVALSPALARAQAATQPAAGAGPGLTVRGDELTPQTDAAIEKGLASLAARQQRDGSFSGGNSDSGVTALAAIAFMSDGNLPGRGKYGENVRRALEFVLKQSQASGLLASPNSDSHGMMYAHGFATLFLAEVYGMTGDDSVRDTLERAIRMIHQAQNPQGGWRYTPQPLDADVSVTICQVMALRAARDAGIKVEKQTIEKAVAYVKKCQNDDGGFSYMLGMGGSQFPRSAAGVATLFYAGVYQGPEVDRGLAYVEQFTPRAGRNLDDVGGYFYYGNYYAVQCMFLAGGEHWAKWFPAIREHLLRTQADGGAWSGEVSEDYATAMALIILQMPKRYLPVFSGKGLGS